MKFRELIANVVIVGILFGAYSVCFNSKAVEAFSQDSARETLTVYVCREESRKLAAKDMDIAEGKVIFLTEDEFNDTLKNKLRIIAKNGYNIIRI